MKIVGVHKQTFKRIFIFLNFLSSLWCYEVEILSNFFSPNFRNNFFYKYRGWNKQRHTHTCYYNYFGNKILYINFVKLFKLISVWPDVKTKLVFILWATIILQIIKFIHNNTGDSCFALISGPKFWEACKIYTL